MVLRYGENQISEAYGKTVIKPSEHIVHLPERQLCPEHTLDLGDGLLLLDNRDVVEVGLESR